jgi:hypothetical protein
MLLRAKLHVKSTISKVRPLTVVYVMEYDAAITVQCDCSLLSNLVLYLGCRFAAAINLPAMTASSRTLAKNA